MYSIGVDIGTSKLCVIVVDIVQKKIAAFESFANNTTIQSSIPYERLQDADAIVAALLPIIERYEKAYSPISIGVSTQMHGILYLDDHGQAISPLYTWQDDRGNLPTANGDSYVSTMSAKTGYSLYSGYGLVTHYWHICHQAVPTHAKKLCTIGDYLTLRLTKKTTPILHVSNAHSLGAFDMNCQDFDRIALLHAGIDPILLPTVSASFETLGTTEHGTAVAIAIGDNQASFFGAVNKLEESMLVNIGTGSQISICVTEPKRYLGLELRPLCHDHYLLCGAALCGGRAYALLERFFVAVTELVTGTPCGSAYATMSHPFDLLDDLPQKLTVDTRFDGTRENPSLRGTIGQIGVENFTPLHLIEGVLSGIASELYELYVPYAIDTGTAIGTLICSGNGIRKNNALQSILAKQFQSPVLLPSQQEEAAYGATIFSLVSCHYFATIEEGLCMNDQSF